jgi:hypothetical protein
LGLRTPRSAANPAGINAPHDWQRLRASSHRKLRRAADGFSDALRTAGNSLRYKRLGKSIGRR